MTSLQQAVNKLKLVAIHIVFGRIYPEHVFLYSRKSQELYIRMCTSSGISEASARWYVLTHSSSLN